MIDIDYQPSQWWDQALRWLEDHVRSTPRPRLVVRRVRRDIVDVTLVRATHPADPGDMFTVYRIARESVERTLYRQYRFDSVVHGPTWVRYLGARPLDTR